MPTKIIFFLFFPFIALGQTFKKDRFVANNGRISWTETVEIKDMDTPIIAETLIDQLKSKKYIVLDSLANPYILTGWLLPHPSIPITKARFRIDILYESYIVTISEIQLNDGTIESTLLNQNGSFISRFPQSIEEIDEELSVIFRIGH
jgi:hypothetical protein